MSNAARIAEMIVEGDVSQILDGARDETGKLDINRLLTAFQDLFPTFEYDDIVQAVLIASELLVADVTSAAEGL